jgi:hypothetical protein
MPFAIERLLLLPLVAIERFLLPIVAFGERSYPRYVLERLQQAASDRTARLQQAASDRTWKDFMPELSEWFGVPLMLAKSLYGDQVADLAWDETQEEWLTSDKIGIRRMPSEYSIFINVSMLARMSSYY